MTTSQVPGTAMKNCDDLLEEFQEHRSRLLMMIDSRLSNKLRARFDADDLLQETFFEAQRRLPEYLDNPILPPFLWLRRLGRQVVARYHRDHLQREKRDAGREANLGAADEAGKCELADQFAASVTGPVSKLARAEVVAIVQDCLNELTEQQRQIFRLKFAEQLTSREIALELAADEKTVRNSYLAAFRKLTRAVRDRGLSPSLLR